MTDLLPVRRLVSLTATAETCRRSRPAFDLEAERVALRERSRLIAAAKTPLEQMPPLPYERHTPAPKLEDVAARLWTAFRSCFPSCATLTAPIASWSLMSRLDLDLSLDAPDPRDELGYAQGAQDRGSATVISTESAALERRRVEIRSWSSSRAFAVTFERERNECAEWVLVEVSVDFGGGSVDRALALGFEYLGMPNEERSGDDPEVIAANPDAWSDYEVELLWSAAPELVAVYVVAEVSA